MGIAALERLLAAGAPAVVVLTGLAGTDIGLAAVAAGAQDYLVKGEVDGETLGRSVRYAIQRRRLEDTDRALYRSLVRAEEVNRLERALLPTPSVVDQRLEVRVGYRAGRDGVLGGDFYDVVERPDGSVLALVGDVCGHGPDEAALGATLRTAWRTLVLAEVPTVDILGLLERVLISERARPEVFTTVSMLDVAAGPRLGRPLPRRPPRAAAPRRAVDAPADARAGSRARHPGPRGWSPVRLELAPSWRILLYTDGVLEATDRAAATTASARPGCCASWTVRSRPQGDLVERVLHDVRELHGGDLVDDAAVVVLGWRA